MATEVMTVTGPLPADQLGFTLVHEHILLELLRDGWLPANMLNDPELAYLELMRFKDAGGVTVVDHTGAGLRASDHDLIPILVRAEDGKLKTSSRKHCLVIRDLAERTGLNIILGCGWYRDTYYEPRVWRMKTDAIAEEILQELTEGIDGTDVRAGLIGEVGSHFNWVSPAEERVLRAAGRAQKKTGVLISTHGTRGPVGLDHLDILEEEGVDLRRVSVCHAHTYPHHEYQAEIARRGAFLSFDRMGTLKTANPFERKRLLGLVKQVLDAGLIKQVLMSHDVCYRSDYATYGSHGYEYVPTQLLNDLREIGVTDEQFHQIVVENPRRALTGED